ncbi:hypothetical protein MPSEU_000378700 [Mayamaea pseudoterrestris]|nr:hypothetical protein MPSEU_000378700 [Mayamaea pseudoterrestris]
MSDQQPPNTKLLPDSFNDGVTAISYLPNPSVSLLAASSWDGTLKVYDTKDTSLQLSQAMESGPLLCLATPGDKAVVTGGLDGSIRRMELSSPSSELIGRHEPNLGDPSLLACSCLAALPSMNVIASAGWNKKVSIWDLRTQGAIANVAIQEKAYAMDADDGQSRLVVATAGQGTTFIDVRKTDHETTAIIALARQSHLKHQIRSVKFFPDGNGIAIASIEGRVSIEHLEDLGLPPTSAKYTFKCHRANDCVYPVNCIAFHPRFGTFATGGCDGTVVIWDSQNKRKVTALPAFPTSISSLAFHPSGNELAIASSYTYEEGEREHPRDEIYIRPVLDSECMPKLKS